MIIGRGLIASTFAEFDSDDILIFASGVSNSSETRNSEFERERNLLQSNLEDSSYKLIIYFSTCSIYDTSKRQSKYVAHKRQMEELVKKYSSGKFLIFRVSNAVRKGGNDNLLLNYLVRSLLSDQPITVHTKASRNLIDVYNIQQIVLHYIAQAKYGITLNVAFRDSFKMNEIIHCIEKHFGREFNKKYLPIGDSYEIDTKSVNTLLPSISKGE